MSAYFGLNLLFASKRIIVINTVSSWTCSETNTAYQLTSFHKLRGLNANTGIYLKVPTLTTSMLSRISNRLRVNIGESSDEKLSQAGSKFNCSRVWNCFFSWKQSWLNSKWIFWLGDTDWVWNETQVNEIGNSIIDEIRQSWYPKLAHKSLFF